MWIPRILENTIQTKLVDSHKAVILYGARQVGKTALARRLLDRLPYRTLSINADEGQYSEILSSRNIQRWRSLVAGYGLVFIDEAQRVPDIGINLKLVVDSLPEVRVLATGSSSFALANLIQEPLTGRTWTYTLHPVAVSELAELQTPFHLEQSLEELLVFGAFPEVITRPNRQEKRELLLALTRSTLYRDALDLAQVKYPGKIRDLLRLLSFQVGSEVSLQELATRLGISRDTVERYIDLLEKSFVLFRLPGFSRNLRKEVRKMEKIFFCDLGVRNAAIENFSPLSQRNDLGQLWENFLLAERRKMLEYRQWPAGCYFWRTHSGAELDYVEERDGRLSGYEFKAGRQRTAAPRGWIDAYPDALFTCVNRENFLDFVDLQGEKGDRFIY
ncbi:MAG: ATP-binding protein [Coprothermobacterota bacterium]|nr:ATP-binding protein [Coprothermobacterota bacterium]